MKRGIVVLEAFYHHEELLLGIGDAASVCCVFRVNRESILTPIPIPHSVFPPATQSSCEC